jgi:hypothetical protein
MVFKLINHRNESEVKEITVIVNDLIVKLYKKELIHFCFEEVGKLNGIDIVLDYINHGELGCAFNVLDI